jgi:hypothetical protein
MTMKWMSNKTVILMFAAMFGFTGFVFAGSPAKNIQGPAVKRPELKVDPEQMKLRTDLSVSHIWSSRCLCTEDLASVGAFLMKNMWITIENRACTNGNQANASGKLKISYFDMVQGRMVNKLVPFTINMNSRTSVKAVTGHVLVKKSTGIKAEIQEVKAPVTDCNSANNRMVVHRCMRDIVR